MNSILVLKFSNVPFMLILLLYFPPPFFKKKKKHTYKVYLILYTTLQIYSQVINICTINSLNQYSCISPCVFNEIYVVNKFYYQVLCFCYEHFVFLEGKSIKKLNIWTAFSLSLKLFSRYIAYLHHRRLYICWTLAQFLEP